MKPSERIAELIYKFTPQYSSPDRTFRAIIQYLDEEYKKNNPKCFCKTLDCNKNEHTYKVKEIKPNE